ncbi:MAG TPA: metallophosphoesterase [Opitutaceae bacterium]
MLRVLSDLHLFDADSRVRRAAQLTPLFHGVDHLVLNGDTCDTERDLPAEELARLLAFFRASVPRVTILTGNHDPAISEQHELLLADGQIWVTHGDVLFPEATPWSTLREELIRRIDRGLAATPEDERHTVAARLRVHRAACLHLPREFDQRATSPLARLNRLRITLFPPHKILAMLRAWRDTPRLAADLAAAQRPSARVVITGHIHNPGVWTRPCGRVVINTGAFGPPRGALLVDLVGSQLTVRKVVERDGHFHPGKVVAEIPLAAGRPASLGSAHA